MSPHARNYIAGVWVDSDAKGQSTSPATGEVLGTFADAGATETDAAIEAASEAFRNTEWSRDRHLRCRALFEMADRMEARRDELILMLSRENGKILSEAAFEIDMTIPKLRYYGALALTSSGRAAEVKANLYSTTLTEAAGVAGVIAPWNSPVVLSVRSFAPALAAGCTVVMKLPAQIAQVNGLLYEIVAETTSLPAGVMNMFTESGNVGAPMIIADPRVEVISYTGSTKVGRIIMQQAATHLKAASLELGGKTPMIVFNDADLDQAVPVLVKAITTFSGQFCMTGSRILVQDGIAGALRTRLVEALEAVKIGPGDDPSSDMGPVIDRANAERIDRAIEDASRYATPLRRGGIPKDPALQRGAYILPSLLEVEDTSSDLVQREIFGPVATFEVFGTEEEAIERANATEYGLAAGIWTRDVDLPRRVGREIKAGTIWTNTWAVIHDEFEEGGFKQSGVGRLNGVRALEEFQEIKHYVHPVGPATSATS
ncbi:aldehyde dehydrogenase family protein [Psychromicrobium sp. YIM B11713]|uniref:aldehyde dehydrogenase family protein n=1 Tax=Psychromicrobium sp. YIM B11713 TaxID=3145233 RepID=UPI00374F8A58